MLLTKPNRADDTRWWRPDHPGSRHEAIVQQVRALQAHYSGWLEQLRDWYLLYRDEQDDGLESRYERTKRTRDNVIQNAIDAAHAKITKNRPKPWVVTIGGRWPLRKRAKLMTKYLEGEFDRLKVYRHTSRLARDAMMFGSGLLKVFRKGNRPTVERTWVGKLLVDPREARLDAVRTLYEVTCYDREVLIEMFRGKPKFAEIELQIRAAQTASDTVYPNADVITCDMVEVIECWHLRSSAVKRRGDDDEEMKEPDHDGRHVICIGNATLLDEPWERDYFPFAKYDWAEDPLGFWGIGLAERMAGTQAEINRANNLEDECFNAAVPSLWTRDAMEINREIIDNSPWRIYRSNGEPPTPLIPPAISDQHLIRKQQLKQDALANQGISALGARAEKPAGLNSGKALRVHHDIESERFASAARRWEDLHMDISRLIDDVTGEILADEDVAAEDLEVHVGREMLEAVRYAEVRIDDAPYEIRTFPVSSLSSTPEGRLRDIEDLIALGAINDRFTILDLLDMPDLDHYNSRETAGRRLVDRHIEKALDGKKVQANPYLPLEYAHRMSILALAEAEDQGAPVEGLDRLRLYIGHVETIAAETGQQLPGMPPPAPAQPQAPAPGPGGPPPGAAQPPIPIPQMPMMSPPMPAPGPMPMTGS